MRERARRRAQALLDTQWPNHISAEVDERLRAEFDILLPREVMRPAASQVE